MKQGIRTSSRNQLVVGLALLSVVLVLVTPACALAGPNAWSRLGGISENLSLLTLSPSFAIDKLAIARWNTQYSDRGGLARSSNGGATWTKFASGVEWVTGITFSPAYAIDHTIYVRSDGHGAPDDDSGPTSRTPCVWRSTDSGNTWSKLAGGTVGDIAIPGLGISPNGRVLVTPTTPAAFMREPQPIAMSTDAGATWKRPFFGNAAVYGTVARRGSSLVCIAEAGSLGSELLVSDDGGLHWQPEAQLDADFSDSSKLVFPTTSNGWIVSSGSGDLRRSTDGGHTWGAAATDIFANYADVTFGSPSSGVAIADGWGWDGAVLAKYTTDGGATWTQSKPIRNEYYGGNATVQLCGVDAVNGSIVFACGRINGIPAIVKSTDGGQTWVSQPLPYSDTSGYTVFAIDMADASNGWAMADLGYDGNLGTYAGTDILRTTDGGGSWTVVHNIADGAGQSAQIIGFDGLRCVIMGPSNGGGGQNLMTTTNGGSTWSKAPTGDSGVYSVAFNGNAGVATLNGMDDNLMLRSSDGGSTWARVPNAGVVGLSALAVSPGFDTLPEMLAVGSYEDQGTFWRSVDGGWSWTPTNVPTQHPDWISTWPSYPASPTIFMGAATWPADRTAFRSRNSGATWSPLGVWAPVLRSPSGPTSIALFAYKPNPVTFRTSNGRIQLTFDGRIQPVFSNNGGDSWMSLGAPRDYDYNTNGGVVPSPNWANDKRIYSIVGGDVWSYTLGPQRKAVLRAPIAAKGSWDRRWVGWCVQFKSRIYPAQPNGWTTAYLEVQKRTSTGWHTYTRVYPWKIDRRGTSARVSPIKLYYSEVLGNSANNYGYVFYVFRSSGRYRVRVRHQDSASIPGGDALSRSYWTYFTLRR